MTVKFGSLGINDAGRGSRGGVFADSQQLSAKCAGPAIAMLIVPIYARQVAAHRNQISRSTVTMNGKVESCSNNQNEQDVNQYWSDQAAQVPDIDTSQPLIDA